MKKPARTRKSPPKRTVFDAFAALFEDRHVDPREIDLLMPIHRNQWLRPEIEAKLALLDPNDSIHQELQRFVSLALDLFAAVDAGEYRPGRDWPDIEPRLKRALVYFVRGGDAIPDHHPTGFDDDHREFLDFARRAELLLAHFEAFRNRSA